jgi:subtilisin family serine protease
VHIGAPGVSVFSTTVGGKYTDLVVDLPAYGLQIGWDGTSMATPHVAGAAALYWSKHPNATWKDVKAALLHSARPIPALTGKSVSEGKLDVQRLMQE